MVLVVDAYGVSEFFYTREFWAVALPAWMQGVGTVLAAFVGLLALAGWRKQETKKRQVRIAEDVLEKALRLANTVSQAERKSPYEDTIAGLKVWIGHYFALTLPEIQARGSELALQLDALKPIAEHYLSKDVGQTITLLRKEWTKTSAALRACRLAEDKSLDLNDEKNRHTMKMMIHVLGGYPKSESVDVSNSKNRQPIVSLTEKLVEQCSYYMTF